MTGLTKILTILGLGVAASAALWFFLGVPVLRDVTSLNSVVKTKKVELATLDQQIRAFKTAQADLAKADRKDEIVNALVEKEELVVSVKELETAAVSTQTAHTIRIKEPDPKDKPVLANRTGFSELYYELSTVSSNFGNVVNFIQYLEHLPHFTEMNSIILSAETTSSEDITTRTGRIFGEFRGAFFVKPLPATTTSITTKATK